MTRELRAQFLAFDLDGTLVNSAPTIMSAWSVWAEGYGISQPSLEEALGGRASDTVKRLLPEHSVREGLAKYLDLERQYLDLGSATPGAREFLNRLRPSDWGVVTSSDERNARERLTHLRLPVPRFVVASDDTDRGKPHPDPYITLLELAERPPSRVVAFEDSATGIASASQAGLQVVKVTINTGDLTTSASLTVVDFLPTHISLHRSSDEYIIGAV